MCECMCVRARVCVYVCVRARACMLEKERREADGHVCDAKCASRILAFILLVDAQV